MKKLEYKRKEILLQAKRLGVLAETGTSRNRAYQLLTRRIENARAALCKERGDKWKAYLKDYRLKNPERIRAIQKKTQNKNPKLFLAKQRLRYYVSKYGNNKGSLKFLLSSV